MNNHLKYLNPQIFSYRLKACRKEKGLNQTEAADELGIPKSSLSYYESGKAIPSLDKAYELAEYYHVSLDYLTGRDMKEPEKLYSLKEASIKIAEIMKKGEIIP